MKKLAAVDAGNKNLNVIVEGMEKPLVIPNTLCNATDLNRSSRFNIFGRRKVNPVNLLDLTIISNGKKLGRKYLGGLAVKHGGAERALRKQKYNDEEILFSILGGLAFPLVKSGESVTERLCLGTCLPSEEYLDEEKVKFFEKRIVGTHEIVFNDPVFKDAKVTIEIYENDIKTLPEGTAALLNICTDEEGRILEEFKDLEDRILIVVDVGGSTTDISAVMNFEPVPELIDSYDRGILYAEERILGILRRKRPDFVMNKNELDYYIRKKNCKLIDGEDYWDIKDIVDREFSAFAQDIGRRVHNLIQIAPDNMKKKIARIVLTGGTTVLLSEYLIKAINGYKIIPSVTSLNDNVLGCYKSIKVLVEEREKIEDEIFEEEMEERAVRETAATEEAN